MSTNRASVPADISVQPMESSPDAVRHLAPWIAIPRLDTAPGVDTPLDAPAWQAAAHLEPFLTPVSGAPARPPVCGRLGMDARGLYAAFECGAPPDAGYRPDDVMHDNRMELYIRPDDSEPCRYYLFTVFLNGNRQAKKKSTSETGAAAKIQEECWEHPWDARVTTTRTGWYVTMIIPWAALEREPAENMGFRLNACCSLTVGPERRRLHASWAYLPEVHFNWPEKFGVALCAGDGTGAHNLTPSSLGLATTGLFSVRRISRIFPVPERFEALCLAALPDHPLLADLRALEVVVSAVSINAAGESGPPRELGRFPLAPRHPARRVVSDRGPVDEELRLRFEGAQVAHEAGLPVMAGSLRHAERLLREAPALAAKDPFRAGALTGLAACLDRIRRQVALESPAGDILYHLREAQARLAALEPENPEQPGEGLPALLRLTRHPEAQVTVEYLHRQRVACVTFYCGALPLVSVEVQEYGSAEEAGRMLPDYLDRRKGSSLLDSGVEPATIAGQPARIHTHIYDPWSHRPMIMPYDPARQVLLAEVKTRTGMAMDSAYLACARVQGVVIMEDCPAGMRAEVMTWAESGNLPVLTAEAAAGMERVLIAGAPPANGPLLDMDGVRALYPMSESVDGTVCAAARRGKYLYAIWQVPRTLAIHTLGLVMAGNPIRPEETDALRAELVRLCGPPGRHDATPPAGLAPCCGDVHIHTSYSHGVDEATPVAMALEALYCGMDFNVISDHDCIAGAQYAQRLCREYGLGHTVMVGAEISAGRSHVNAFPLKEVIRAATERDAIAAAHKQGAIIQWNHPDSDVAAMTAQGGEAFDAWEHLPRRFYKDWTAEDRWPAVTGSSDSHNGTFAFLAFGHFERTLLWAVSCREEDLVDAIRRRRVMLVTPAGGRYFYGPAALAASAWAALADGRGLKAARAARLREVLAGADLVGLVTANHPTRGRDRH